MDEVRPARPNTCRSLRFLLLLGCAGISACGHRALAAGAQPAGGHYVAGAGGIVTSGATTTITQSSHRGVIDWRSFSVGKGNTVQFDNGSGATLNRVTGGKLSTIAGQLSATGSVYLINRNGVVVQAGGKVVTGGDFVASTRNVSDSQFMAGGAQTFAGTSNGAVVNDGAIVSQDGNVALIGHAVTNNGGIGAAKGTASLTAADRVVLSDASGPAGLYVAAGASGDTTNSGRIKAAAVALASAGGNVYALAGNRTGMIQASGTKTIDGQVWLTASDGTVDVDGKVAAANADGSGGAITAKGDTLSLAQGAVLNAAGRTGHGKIETSGNHVSIGKAKVTAGQHGDWMIDPVDLTIDSAAATAIEGSLGVGTNVFERTTFTTSVGSGTPTPGVGDINVEAAITWSTIAQLSLSAFHSINIDAPINATGNGQVVLLTNNNLGGGVSSGGTLNFKMGQGSLQIGGATGGLTIDGNSYTLVHNTVDLQAVASTGFYALAANLDAGGVVAYVPIGEVTAFAGTFNGLGNSVSNLTVTNTLGFNGLFGKIGAGGSVTDIAMTNGSVSGSGLSGALAGLNQGTIINAVASTPVTGVNSAPIGGLVGDNFGTIINASASGLVTGAVSSLDGGLVGQNEATGTITGSHTTGTTQGDNDSANGGLAGINYGAIANSYATGLVTTALGSGSAQANGGLVGDNYQTGTISDSYATGAVVAHTSSAYAAGLSGYNDGAISNSYATGSVTAGAGTTYAGGLVGLGDVHGTITGSYATGVTTGAAFNIGGLVGTENGAAAVNSYWDKGTTGQITSATGTGKTTAELQAGLLAGFSVANWSILDGKSYPYLNFQFTSGTPQVVAGTVYTDGGTTNAGAGVTVNALVNGGVLNSTLTGGAVTTGANGYYYYLVAPGGIAASGNVLTYAQGYGSGALISGAALADNSDGYPTHLDILGSTLHVETNDAVWSLAKARLLTAEGVDPTAITVVGGLADLRVDAGQLSPFAVNTTMSATGNVIVNAAGELDLAGGAVNAGGSVTLASAGAFKNTTGSGAITVGAGQRWLVYSSTPVGNIDGGLSEGFIQYGATYPASVGVGSVLGYGTGTAPLGSGNGFLYSLSPTLTLTNVRRTYDGTTNLVGSGGSTSFTVSGLVGGDALAGLGGSPTGGFASNNAGGGILVSVSGLTATVTHGGATVFGYTVTPVVNAAIGTINKANLTVSLTGTVSKVYDGTTLASLAAGNYAMSGLITGDAVTVSAGSTVYAGKNAGTGLNVTASGLSLSGADANNYQLTSATGTGHVGVITPATLTYTADTSSRTYGAANPGFAGAVTGFVTGDTLANATSGTLTFTSGATTASNVGTYAIDGSGLTADHGNYVFVQATGNATALTVTPASLVITARDASKTYGQTQSFGGTQFTTVGLQNGETIGSVTLASSGAGARANAGTYDISASNATGGTFDAVNYAISYQAGTLTVNPAILTAGLTGSIGRPFNATTAATLSPANYTLTGLVNGDSVSLNDPTGGSYATAQPGSGIAITVGGLALEGAGAGNYRLAATTVTANIGTITAAPSAPGAPATGESTNLVPVVPPGGGSNALVAGAGNALGQLPAIVKKDAAVVDANGTVLSSGLHPSATPVPMVAPALASGCANEDMVAVLPEANGHVGAVVVESGGNKTLLNSAYASCSGSKPGKIDPQLVKNVFGDVLAARPTPPVSYQLFCKAGSVALVPSSVGALDDVLQEIKRRTAADVVVTGFTDTTGKTAQNDILSLQRAKSVAGLLVARGVAATAMTTIGRGEHGLLVPTRDQVAEEKNRRIEVTVR